MLDIPEFDMLTANELKEINDACQKFENLWGAEISQESSPSLIENLSRLLNSSNAKKVEFRRAACHALVDLDIAHRRKRGQAVSRESYLQCLPNELATVIDRFGDLSLAEVDFFPIPGQDCQVGYYHIVQEIGQGGMGRVYLAQQHEPVRRLVALKVIKSSSPTREVLARFELERQALASMDHPNIAKILDVGITDSHRPYFAMEWVKGATITKFCDERNLSLSERLSVFQQVCGAIQHAHQNGIIHRDLKPTNVLVTEVDNRPVTKVIDFGLARAIRSGEFAKETMLTQEGQLIGTVIYMSPEQADLDPKGIDTRTDVYALGVMLYELLTGSTPLAPDSVRNKKLLEVLHHIRHSEPVRPSRGLTSSAKLVESANARRLSPAALTRALRGDLDCIVMKALHPEKEVRYQSPSLLASDIDRYLKGQPISARPPSAIYSCTRFIARNRVVSSFLGLLFLTILAWFWQLQEKIRVDKVNRQLVEQSQIVSTELLSEQNRFDLLSKHDDPFATPPPDSPANISNDDILRLPGLLSQSRARRARFWNEFGLFLGSNKNAVSLNQAISCLTYGLDDLESLREDDDTLQLDVVYQDVIENRAYLWELTGDKEKAAEDYQRVLELLTTESKTRPENQQPDYDLQLRIAKVHYRMAPNTTKTQYHYEEALALLEPQLTVHPKSLEIYLRCCHDLEHITVDNAKGIELLENGMRAVEAWEHGTNRDLWLAWYRDALGRRLNMQGNRTSSIAQRRLALELTGQYLSKDPASVAWSKIDTRVKFNLAISGGIEESESIRLFREIADQYQPIIQSDPSRAQDTVHVMSQLNTGIALVADRNPLEATVYLRRARELIEQSNNKSFLVDTQLLELLALSLVDPLTARVRLEAEIDPSKAGGKSLAYFNAARINIRAHAARSEEGHSDYFEKAISYLLEARNSNSWESSLQKQFEQEPDLEPLRKDPRILAAFGTR